MATATQPPKWWKDATGYQIWPASYKDSNSDGIGDIPGITSTLDYLKHLGVDFIWLSPVYDSPQHDAGYDVRDYENIWAKYGTMEDMDALIGEVHARGMRIIMDLVVNHTSNEHRWFQESKKSKSNPYSNWYIWRDPKYEGTDGKRHPPNNWRAAFGGSVWTYVPERDQYYLHLALPEQPDLNWQNDATRKAIYTSAVEFWLKKGIDGFRVDVVNFYWKDPSFPDAKVVLESEEYQPMEAQHILNGPKMHDWLREQRIEALDKYGEDVVLIGELPGTSREEVLRYVSAQSRELDMVFDFDIFMAGNDWNTKLHDFQPFKLPELKDALIKTQGYLANTDAWTTTFIENHDNARSVSRFGPGEGEHKNAAAKMLALFITTLSGTLFIYQGQEIGMSNVPPHWTKEDFRDKAIMRYFEEIEQQYPGDEKMRERAIAAARQLGRDNARTPVQWSSEPNGGFSTVEPWIRVNDNFEQVNAARQLGDGQSVLEFWRRMIKVRTQHKDVFIYGVFELLDRDNATTVSFLKTSQNGEKKVLVVLNFSGEEADLYVPEDLKGQTLELVISSAEARGAEERLRPWEGRAYAVKV